MLTFDLKNTIMGDLAGCSIFVGRYPKGRPTDPVQTAWQVYSAHGDALGVPTVNLWDPPTFPDPGCVFIKTTPEFCGWLDSMEAADLVKRTGRIEAAGFVERYAAECRVLKPELLAVHDAADD